MRATGERRRPGTDSSVDQRPWRPAAVLALAGLGGSIAALAAAPALMPPTYSWVSMTTSESAAQGMQGAWVARLGFLLFGLSVLLLATVCRWEAWSARLHVTFGVLMTAAAAFSHRPFDPAQRFDRTEDLLHSVAATGMGFAFAFAVILVVVSPAVARLRLPWRMLDLGAAGASVAIPAAMATWPQISGVLQRLMFSIAYAWYAGEAVQALREPARAERRRAAA
jgi:hypothetical protein